MGAKAYHYKVEAVIFSINFEVGCLENGNDDFLKAEGLVLSLSSSLALPCQGKEVYQVRDNLLFTMI